MNDVTVRRGFVGEPMGAMPPAEPLDMPVQNLKAAPAETPSAPHEPEPRTARAFVFGGAFALSAFSAYEMYEVVAVGGVTVAEALFVALYILTFSWIAFSCISTLVGSIWALPHRETPDPSVPLATRNALAMPVYNEDPALTAAGLRAMAEALREAGQAHAFEIVVLSDTTDPDAWVRETLAYRRLRRQLSGIMPVWYRRRWKNTGRKAGNIGDFVATWGGRYDHFIVLDADSILSAETIIQLVARMQNEPRLGILQTVPMLAGGTTLLARLQQFAGWLYGPSIARGLAAWTHDDGNFWGHNAIIRTQAFAQSAGLPELKGPRPVGGMIMSHDFVEAALVRRAGWAVRMAPELGGSFEDSPPSLIDLAVRDRRWAQGNLQHSGVLPTRGLTLPSRIHLANGIMSYLSSPLWLALILTGLGLALQAQLTRPEYFSGNFQLFPSWPIFDSERMLHIFIATMGVLLLPKLIGYLRALFTTARRRACGGALGLTASFLAEIILSALYAPIMMLIQSRQVFEILIGRDSGWSSQRRTSEGEPWGVIWGWHHWHFLAGIVLATGSWFIDPALFAWLSPISLGLALVLPLSWASGRPGIGRWLRRARIFVTAPEVEKPTILALRDGYLKDDEALPEDGLSFLADNHDDAVAHAGFNLPRPAPGRGAPDPDMLTAREKLGHASSRAEALSWLNKPERIAVAADAGLLERLTALPLAAPAQELQTA